MSPLTTFCLVLGIGLAIGDEYHPEGPKLGSAPRQTLDRDWFAMGQERLNAALQIQLQTGVAKNVILFVGDGMGVSTVSAARLFNMQIMEQTFENSQMAWERFPHLGLSKTYNTNRQTSDSAGTATAFLTGYKSQAGVLGVTQDVAQGDCQAALSNPVTSILKYSIQEGKWAGLVTTTGVTHATPAAAYANSPNRQWEANTDDPNCEDIAYQLVHRNPNINVILGGGREMFRPEGLPDPEYPTDPTMDGERSDLRDLIQEWEQEKRDRGIPENRFQYVDRQSSFDAVDPTSTDYLLGLFEPGHMHFEHDRQADDVFGEPSLAEMTEKAIRMLSRNENGFFLEVEGGRIDHAHHTTNAYRSMRDTVAMSDAVQRALDLTNENETLIVVTADHSHTFTMAGYPSWSNHIMGIVDKDTLASDLKPYTTLSYANGPGEMFNKDPDTNERDTLNNAITTDPDYFQDTNVPQIPETHSGEDVAIHARGPMAHLFHGVHEQSYIAHAMMYASCVGPNKQHCQPAVGKHRDCRPQGSDAIFGWGCV